MKVSIPLVLTILLTACVDGERAANDVADRNTGGSGTDTADVFVYMQDEGGWSGPAMAFAGELSIRQDCLVIESTGEAALPLWPESTSVRKDANGSAVVEVRKDDAVDHIPLGQTFSFAGDMIAPELARTLSSQSVPDRCPGRVFRTAGVRQ